MTTAVAAEKMIQMLDGVSRFVETKKEKETAKPKVVGNKKEKTAKPKALEAQKLAELNEQEAIIAKGQEAFFATALAILAIVQKKLFKVVRMGQGAYFMTRWSLSGTQVSRYIAAGAVLKHLAKKFDVMPQNEGQCRALADVKTEELQAAVWKACIESGEKITAKTIADLARRIATTGKATVSEEEHAEAVAFIAKSSKIETTTIALSIENHDLEEMTDYFGTSVNRGADTGSVVLKIEGTRQQAFKKLMSWKRFHEIKVLVVQFGN